ncbi:MAG: 3-hydroxyacyl-CoA dehydrogenase family protein [Chloroflexi bacterium]|nr:3-hydroxyacyl-CoA dehydrogenase family protein [Chloroflexota bacterium]
MSKITHVGIVGTGIMGSGIALLCAQAGYGVALVGRRPESVARGMDSVKAWLGRLVERKQMTAQAMEEVLGRVQGTTDLNAVKRSGMVIEAIAENLEVKKELFQRLDKLCPPETILASDTATLPIREMAQATGRPDKVIGMHLLSPAPLSKIVEVVRSELTSEDTVQRSRAFCESLGLSVVVVKDSPGFIINRLLAPYLLDAVRLVEQGVASKEDIDTCMRLGCGYPAGPLRLLDLVGLDQFHDLASSLYQLLGDPKYKPPQLLTDMVAQGKLGRKSREGFYKWD